MGDFFNNIEVFKKLGLDSSKQYILENERFQKFFEFLAENITDSNILTENEVLEYEELHRRKEILPANDRIEKLKALNCDYPGLIEYNDTDIVNLINEIASLEKAEDMYSNLVEDMRLTKTKINCEITDLEASISELVNCGKSLYNDCSNKTKELCDIQKENRKLCIESKECFIKMHSPPLFVHQLPLDQYFLKCESFSQYLNLYVTENFKIQEYLDLDENDIIENTTSDLEPLRKLYLHYNELLIKEKAKAKATQAMIDNLRVSNMHILNILDMKKETRELKVVNQHHFNITYDTLMADLLMHLEQRTQQYIELIVYENTKEKLNRACSRRENVLRLTKIVSDALSNAELIWITIQLDLDKIKNRFDNTNQLNSETYLCLRRIEHMKSRQNISNSEFTDSFVTKVVDLLSSHSTLKICNNTKSCLYEYEKFCRLLKFAFLAEINKKSIASLSEIFKNLNRLEQTLKPIVYDSPVLAPMFENTYFLKPIFCAKMKQNQNYKQLVNLRSKFQQEITEKMIKDKFWRYKQLLWIWFLTEPMRLIRAIDDVKKEAAKHPPITGVKYTSGIKRK